MHLFTNEYCFEPTKERIGKEIKALMKKNNLTAEKLFKKLKEENKYLDINNVKTIQKWTSGNAIPKIDTLQALKKVFNVTLDEIVLPDGIYKGDFHLDNRDFCDELFKLESFLAKNITKSDDSEPYLDYNSEFPILVDNNYLDMINFNYLDNYIDRWEYLTKKKFYSLTSKYEDDEFYCSFTPFKDKKIDYAFGVNNFNHFYDEKETNIDDMVFDFILGCHPFKDYFVDIIALIYLYECEDYYIKLFSLLSPIHRDFLYNYLIVLNDNSFEKSMEVLSNIGAVENDYYKSAIESFLKEGRAQILFNFYTGEPNTDNDRFSSSLSKFFVKRKDKMDNINKFAVLSNNMYIYINSETKNIYDRGELVWEKYLEEYYQKLL